MNLCLQSILAHGSAAGRGTSWHVSFRGMVHVYAYGVSCPCVQLEGGVGSIFVDLVAQPYVGAQSSSPVSKLLRLRVGHMSRLQLFVRASKGCNVQVEGLG
jgi:hypothetical protein